MRRLSVLLLSCALPLVARAADTSGANPLSALPTRWMAVDVTKDGPVVSRTCAARPSSITLDAKDPAKVTLKVDTGQKEATYRATTFKAGTKPGTWEFQLEGTGGASLQATLTPYDAKKGFAEWRFPDAPKEATGRYAPEENARKLREVWEANCSNQITDEAEKKRQLVVAPDGPKGSGCDLSVPGFSSREEFVSFFEHLQEAVKADDKDWVANLVAYPLAVNGKKRSVVKTPAELKKAYATIFTPAIKQAILDQKLDAFFCRDQGAMFGGGEAWAGPRKEGKGRESAGLIAINPAK